jgi:hypothetical protein
MGLAQRNEAQVEGTVCGGVDRVRYGQKRLLYANCQDFEFRPYMRELHISMVAYFLTSVGGVSREVVAPAGHAAREHQNFRGIDN